MIQPRVVAMGLAATLGMVAVAIAVSVGLERFFSTPVVVQDDAITFPQTAASDVAHINATLFYIAEDGQSLVGVRREVPLAEGRIEQGRQILMLALTPAPAGYISPLPRGTSLRSFYVTDRGDAFIDLSRQASSGHPGGSFAEALSVSALVNDVTANLPAVQRVQILIEGQQADTLAGHVDLRRPLLRDSSLVATGK